MKSFLVVEKGEELLIKDLCKELWEIKVLVDKLNITLQERNLQINRIIKENLQLREQKQKLLLEINKTS